MLCANNIYVNLLFNKYDKIICKDYVNLTNFYFSLQRKNNVFYYCFYNAYVIQLQ